MLFFHVDGHCSCCWEDVGDLFMLQYDEPEIRA